MIQWVDKRSADSDQLAILGLMAVLSLLEEYQNRSNNFNKCSKILNPFLTQLNCWVQG